MQNMLGEVRGAHCCDVPRKENPMRAGLLLAKLTRLPIASLSVRRLSTVVPVVWVAAGVGRGR